MGKWIDTDAAYAVLTDYYHHTLGIQHAALKEALGRVESVDAAPCDVCRYSPPSSGDGKPCTICPAEGKDGEQHG